MEQHLSHGHAAIRYRSWDLKHQSDLDYYSLFRRNLTNVISFPFCSLLPLCTFFSLVFESHVQLLFMFLQLPLSSHTQSPGAPAIPPHLLYFHVEQCSKQRESPVQMSCGREHGGKTKRGRSRGAAQGRLSSTLMVSRHSGL